MLVLSVEPAKNSAKMYLLIFLLFFCDASAQVEDSTWHAIVTPKVIDARRNANEIGYPDSMKLMVGEFSLVIELNKKILPPTFTQKYYENGKEIIKKNHVNCFYQGSVEGYPQWKVILCICYGLRGQFGDFSSPTSTYLIEPRNKSNYSIEQPHDLYTIAEEEDDDFSCGSNSHSHTSNSSNNSHFLNEHAGKGKERLKRQNTLGELIIEMAVIVDNLEFTSTTRGNSDVEIITQRIFSITNYMDDIFRTYLDIRIVLVYLEIWTDSDKINHNTDSVILLADFIDYTEGIPENFDVAMLVSGINFDGVVGRANLNVMCSSRAAAVNQDFRVGFNSVGTVMCHELGHILNMQHDDNYPSRIASCACPDPNNLGQCIMAASVGHPPAMDFSNCSQNEANFALYSLNRANCLYNTPSVYVMPPVCGNGFVEDGETCDCGTIAECTNHCCNPSTCSLVAGANCAHGDCCNTTICEFHPRGFVCREILNQCDIREYCSGTDILCPPDELVQIGTVCQNNGEVSICSGKGDCVLSRSKQCEIHFLTFDVPMECYMLNTRGVVDGHCGSNLANNSFIPCAPENILCGLMWCDGVYFGKYWNGISPDITSYDNTLGGTSCKTVSSSASQPVQLGLISDGTYCDDGKVCFNQVCNSLSNITVPCPIGTNGQICSGNGQCNQFSNCSCYHEYQGNACEQAYDVDECANAIDNCQHNCVNIVGSYTCTCNIGYILDSDGWNCSDINECSTNNSGCSQTCNNTVGSFSCGCNVGYTLGNDGMSCNAMDGTACSDINECSTNNSGCSQTCTNTVGSFSCGCNMGYTLGNDGMSCNDKNECSTNDSGCSQTCTNTVGSFSCGCNMGYTLGNDGMSCNDINECSTNNSGCSQTCINTVGSFSCGCNMGYTLGNDGMSCNDINECSTNNSGCSQTCTNTVGSFSCGCNMGYTLGNDGMSCNDINECSTNNSGCSQTCTNTVGSFSCGCNMGYTLGNDGMSCNDINECSTNNSGCSQTCTNTVGSFSCGCNMGYTLGNDGMSCNDINECSTNNSGCSQTCTNTVGSFSCGCNMGYTLGNDGMSCNDINECSTNNGGCSQTCTNTVGSFSCGCNIGYTLGNDGMSCNDINECSTNNSGCSQTCTNTVGSFSCGCNMGYTLGNDGMSCNDINECSTNNGGCSQTCTNTVGSFSCGCNMGYTLGNDGMSCNDINECSTNNSSCSHTCTNTVGSFSCGCNMGYTLGNDGMSCNDVDECSTNNGGCSQTCTNTVGSFFCGCNTGNALSNDGVSCEDVDECAVGSNNCQHNCVNTPGSYTCMCNIGYTLSGDGWSCFDVDECAAGTNNCEHNCVNSVGSYSCTCNPGFVLTGDGWNCSDSDRCIGNNGGCSHTCSNTVGSFVCSCYNGYLLDSDGASCVDANECNTSNGGCDHICTNTEGSYECRCRTWYTLLADGHTCNATEGRDGLAEAQGALVGVMTGGLICIIALGTLIVAITIFLMSKKSRKKHKITPMSSVKVSGSSFKVGASHISQRHVQNISNMTSSSVPPVLITVTVSSDHEDTHMSGDTSHTTEQQMSPEEEKIATSHPSTDIICQGEGQEPYRLQPQGIVHPSDIQINASFSTSSQGTKSQSLAKVSTSNSALALEQHVENPQSDDRGDYQHIATKYQSEFSGLLTKDSRSSVTEVSNPISEKEPEPSPAQQPTNTRRHSHIPVLSIFATKQQQRDRNRPLKPTLTSESNPSEVEQSNTIEKPSFKKKQPQFNYSTQNFTQDTLTKDVLPTSPFSRERRLSRIPIPARLQQSPKLIRTPPKRIVIRSLAEKNPESEGASTSTQKPSEFNPVQKQEPIVPPSSFSSMLYTPPAIESDSAIYERIKSLKQASKAGTAKLVKAQANETGAAYFERVKTQLNARRTQQAPNKMTPLMPTQQAGATTPSHSEDIKEQAKLIQTEEKSIDSSF